jgi:hypothetical protein
MAQQLLVRLHAGAEGPEDKLGAHALKQQRQVHQTDPSIHPRQCGVVLPRL